LLRRLLKHLRLPRWELSRQLELRRAQDDALLRRLLARELLQELLLDDHLLLLQQHLLEKQLGRRPAAGDARVLALDLPICWI